MTGRKRKIVASVKYDEAKKKAVIEYPEDGLLPELPEKETPKEDEQ